MTKSRVMWVARTGGKFVGTKRYSYKIGTHNALGEFSHARLFSRRQDAEQYGVAVSVDVILHIP